MAVHHINSGFSSDSNIFLVVGSRTALIDTGTGHQNKRNIAKIKEILKERSLDMIILTHFHADHSGGLKGMMDEFGSEAFIGAGDAPYIISADPEYTYSEMFDVDLEPVDVSELMEGDVIDLGVHKLNVINTPGHTCGGICLYDEVTNSLFSGDTVFSQGVGRTDFPTGSSKELTRSLERLCKIKIKTLYPGHMDITSDGNRAVMSGLRMMGVFY